MGIEADIEESLSHEARAVVALEQVGEALTVLAKLASQWFDKVYPERKTPVDAKVTKLPTEEDELRESLGSDGSETLEDWTTLGPRERKLVEKDGK